MSVTKIGANGGADYYRVATGEKAVTIRVSVLYNVAPLCLTCVRTDCEHVVAFESAQAAA